MSPYDQLCHDMVGSMCNALQYMKNAVEAPETLPITAEAVKTVHDDFTRLIKRYHTLRDNLDLTSLSLTDVKEALANAGYSFPEITNASYVGRGPSGAHIYKIDFFDVNNGVDTVGRVFIKMRDGKPVGEF